LREAGGRGWRSVGASQQATGLGEINIAINQMDLAT
jgi:hypothetical protein